MGAVGHLLQMAMAFVAMLLMTKPMIKGWLESDAPLFKVRSNKKKGHLSLVDNDEDDNSLLNIGNKVNFAMLRFFQSCVISNFY